MSLKGDEAREWYRARRKRAGGLSASVDEAGEAAFVEAVEEAFERGRWLGRIQVIQGLLDLPLTSKQELDALPIENLQIQAQALEKQWRSRSK